MPTPGQPTLYKPDYCELAHNYCLLGATNQVLAGFFRVAPRTVDNWIATHPDFADAVYRGRAVADAVVGRALFERAKGFSHQVTRTTLYRQQAGELDRARREAVLFRIQQLMVERTIFAPIWQLAFINGVGPRVGESGFGLIPLFPYTAPYEDITLKGG